MNFEKAKAAGAKFVFIKVSERGGMDEDFKINWANAKAAGIPRGGYHFLRWDVSGLLQARIFCSCLKMIQANYLRFVISKPPSKTVNIPPMPCSPNSSKRWNPSAVKSL